MLVKILPSAGYPVANLNRAIFPEPVAELDDPFWRLGHRFLQIAIIPFEGSRIK